MMRSLSKPGLRRRRLLGLACCSMLSGAVFRDVAAQSRQMPLDSPAGLTANDVTVRAAQHAGRSGVAVELTDSAQKQLLAGTGIGNGPTFAMPELRLANGWMEVDVAAQINGRGAPDSRGFVGLAFHIADDLKTFEAVYLRMTNGSLNDPPPPAPRNVYAVQYIAFPDRYWDPCGCLALRPGPRLVTPTLLGLSGRSPPAAAIPLVREMVRFGEASRYHSRPVGGASGR